MRAATTKAPDEAGDATEARADEGELTSGSPRDGRKSFPEPGVLIWGVRIDC